MSIVIGGRTVSGLYNVSVCRTATDSQAGIIRLATKAEILAGTTRESAITPYDIKEMIKVDQLGDGFAVENGFIDNTVYPLVPTAATVDNQLADKAYVLDLIQTYSSRFIGIYESLEALQADTRPAVSPVQQEEEEPSGEGNEGEGGEGQQSGEGGEQNQSGEGDEQQNGEGGEQQSGEGNEGESGETEPEEPGEELEPLSEPSSEPEQQGEPSGEEEPSGNEGEGGESSGEEQQSGEGNEGGEPSGEEEPSGNEGEGGEPSGEGNEGEGGETEPEEPEEEDTRKVVTQNDYALILFEDNLGNVKYDRYSFNGEEWVYEYAFSNLTFTEGQWNAINSGITAQLVSQIKYPSGACTFYMDGQYVGRIKADSTTESYISLTSKTPTWGAITGTITDQTDLVQYLSSSLSSANQDLSNLSTEGMGLIKASKALKTGEEGDNSIILSQLKELAVTKPDISGLTVVGAEVQVSNDYIARDFFGGVEGADASYITCAHTISNPTKVIVNIGFTPALKMTPNTAQCIFAFTTDNNYTASSKRFSLETNQAGNTLLLNQYDTDGTAYSSITLGSVTAGTKYECRLVLTSNHVKAYLNGTEIRDVDLRTTLDCGSSIQIGLLRHGSKNWAGTIDLKDLYVIADSDVVVSGCEMNSATHILSNKTVVIPYRVTSLGQKIADIEFKDLIEDVYEDKGYAPYYTLGEGKYSLPIGDVYAMIDTRIDKKEAASAAAPNSSSSEVTLKPSGQSYTAPDDGTFILRMSVSDEAYVELASSGANNNGDIDSDRLLVTTDVTYNIIAKLRVYKGQSVVARYSGGTPSLRFIKANGAV